MRTASDKTIRVDTFIAPDALDPIYFSDRSYYLVPSGKADQHPFGVLQQVMAQENRYAVAQVIFAGRDQLVLLRPFGRLLAMTMLSFQVMWIDLLFSRKLTGSGFRSSASMTIRDERRRPHKTQPQDRS